MAHLVSCGASLTFLTKVIRSLRALPPSPPVRYFISVAIAASIFDSRSSRVKSNGTAGAEGAFLTVVATGLTATGAAVVVEVDEVVGVDVSVGAEGSLRAGAEGLYPSTPRTDGNTPLLSLRSSLSLAISARSR